jgi:predicted metalloprotease
MTFNDNVRIDPGKVRRGGGRRGGIVAGGGLGALALVLLSQLLGVDLTGLGGDPGQDTGTTSGESSFEECRSGADANASVECRMVGAADAIDTYWAEELPAMGGQYRTPEFVIFEESVSTACGGATSAVGPFYCPPDQTIYIDTGFYDDLRSRFGASGGPLAEMYVVAHEWGHHIQNITGIMNGVDRRGTGPTSDAVRLELQADCFAGSWAGEASTTPDPDTGVPFLEPISQQQVADAMDAAAAVGDDRIQSTVSGDVQPHTWTHGSSEQRQRWFLAGYEQGAGVCDTFAAPSL